MKNTKKKNNHLGFVAARERNQTQSPWRKHIYYRCVTVYLNVIRKKITISYCCIYSDTLICRCNNIFGFFLSGWKMSLTIYCMYLNWCLRDIIVLLLRQFRDNVSLLANWIGTSNGIRNYLICKNWNMINFLCISNSTLAFSPSRLNNVRSKRCLCNDCAHILN